VYGRGAAGFMGKTWDTGEVAFSEEFWAEVLRVLKPGGHVVAFSGTRTYHRMAVAIEDAGFEIRDQLGWLYGSGFAKSHAVDLGLWKGAIACQSKENAPLVVQVSAFTHLSCDAEKGHIVAAPALILPEGAPALIMEIGTEVGSSEVTVMSLSESEAASISLSTGWSWERRLVDLSDPRSMYTTETKSRLITTTAIWKSLTSLSTQKFTRQSATLQNGWTWPAVAVASNFSGDATSKNATPILTALASATWNPVAQAKGIGSGLKPAWEPICLARKPLVGTVAENVMQWGTGALNIDGCRVGTEGGTAKAAPVAKSKTVNAYGNGLNGGGVTQIDAGRWPANIVHDGSDEVLAAFPDGGAPARFFYCAKASRKDRDEGLEGFEGRADAAHRRTNIEETADNPYLRGVTVRKNTHPTVKPTDIMRWLCRLVTPPGGLILDPFMGSGSTGKAALLEGFRFIGCERENEYMPIALARIAAVVPVAAANDNEPVQLALFA